MVAPKTAVTLIAVVVLMVKPDAATAQAEHLSRVELNHLMAHANKPADYQELATFFHWQEDVYRAKAQAAMDDYASCARRFLMAPKFPTRADQDFRLFDYYSAKADGQAELAERYDNLLLANGIKPRPKIRTISIHDLQNSALPQSSTAALPRSGLR